MAAAEGTDKVSSDQSLRLPGLSTKSIEGAPWWVKAGFLFLSMVGIPGALVAVREFKDWKFEERRLDVERQRIEQQAKTNVMLEQLGGALRRLEKKLPAESANGGDR